MYVVEIVSVLCAVFLLKIVIFTTFTLHNEAPILITFSYSFDYSFDYSYYFPNILFGTML
jgi:hypothetical protein